MLLGPGALLPHSRVTTMTKPGKKSSVAPESRWREAWGFDAIPGVSEAEAFHAEAESYVLTLPPPPRNSRARLPWKRGPVAHEVAQRADEILAQLGNSVCHPRSWLSLRASARLLGVSTQPLRDWIRRGYLARAHPRRITKPELERLVCWLQKRSVPYAEDRLHRIYGNGCGPGKFEKLNRARICWPKGCASLTTGQLAELAGCHRSLIFQAIKQDWLRVRQPHRYGRQWWRISRQAWREAFPLSMVEAAPRLPQLPPGQLFGTRKAAEHLGACGMVRPSQRMVRRLMAKGKLSGVRPPGKHKWHVTRQSLIKFRQFLKNNS